MPKTRPPLKLVGEDGNAFLIMGRAQRAAKAAGWTREEIDEYLRQARSGDYNKLLQVTMEMFDVDGGDEDDEEEEWPQGKLRNSDYDRDYEAEDRLSYEWEKNVRDQ